MSKSSSNVPALRFREFSAPWETQPLSAVLQPKRKRNLSRSFGREHVLSVAGDAGVVNQIEHLGRSYAGVDLEMYHVVELNDVVYTKSPLKAAPYGIIKVNFGPAGIVSTLYAVYTVQGNNHPKFVDYYFSLNDRLNSYLRPLVHIGAKNDMKISAERVLIDPVKFPEEDEQKRISVFLTSIDNRINLLTRKAEITNRYKREVARRLFERELRFRRDDGSAYPEWRSLALGATLDWKPTNSLSREKLILKPDERWKPGEVQNLHYGDIHTKFPTQFRQADQLVPCLACESDIAAVKQSAFCEVGDLVIADASEDYSDIGKTIEILEVAPRSLVAGLHTLLARPKKGVLAPGFGGYLFQSPNLRRQVMRSAQGISVLGISKTQIEKIQIDLPHVDEQRRIADFLSALDGRAAALRAKIATMQRFKKGLLQKMFV